MTRNGKHGDFWRLLGNRLGPVAALVAVFALFAIKVPESFLTLTNIETIARQTTIVGVAALGMTVVILAGGIDLSAGSIVAFSSVIVAAVLKGSHSAWLAVAGGIGMGVICGVMNGILATKLKVVPFIVTLGTMLIVRGAAKGIAAEQKIDPNVASWIPTLTASLDPEHKWMLVPPGVWIMFALAVAVGCMLTYTKFGKHVAAVGSNEQTARLCGVRVDRVKIAVYAIGAGAAGLAGVMQFSRLTVGDPTVAVGLELDVIAAVVIGGGSLSGGEGSVSGTIVGALIMTVIEAGCAHMDLRNWIQEIVTGCIIVLAVGLDRLRRRTAA